ncbi:hypothetical protein [Butyrivibrio sp. INlla14]|uniref:hypothetical protein n=1 Tax=Butyrivibrio sp. INlla14 TaxID=1520808 RepID=UPI0008767393|nr:hypothetical protein [Butyrivibrio sp. INlla14]SCY01407.1 hypothetical protein SAMN02910371_00725 [Butyrivibrio sp. INlla14]
MNFIPLKVSLDEACMSDFSRRYHFEEKDKNEIEKLYIKASPRVHAQFHYCLLNNKGEALEKENTKAAKQALVVVTLGQAFDVLQDSFLSSTEENIHKAYILDCIGLELLARAYEEVDKKLHELTGMYAGRYIFAGEDKLPMSEVPRLMGLLGQKLVTYNEAMVLIPKKSVLFVVPLLTEPVHKPGLCSMCDALDCAMRQGEV